MQTRIQEMMLLLYMYFTVALATHTAADALACESAAGEIGAPIACTLYAAGV